MKLRLSSEATGSMSHCLEVLADLPILLSLEIALKFAESVVLLESAAALFYVLLLLRTVTNGAL